MLMSCYKASAFSRILGKNESACVHGLLWFSLYYKYIHAQFVHLLPHHSCARTPVSALVSAILLQLYSKTINLAHNARVGKLTCCANAVLDGELALVCLILQALVVAQILHLPPKKH